MLNTKSKLKKIKSYLSENWKDYVIFVFTFLPPCIKWFTDVANEVSWVLIILLSLIILLLIILSHLANKLKNIPALTWSYCNIDTNCQLYFVDRKNMFYSRKVRIRALKKGANDFIVCYDWTGNSVENIEFILNRGHELKFSSKKVEDGTYQLQDNITISLHNGLNIGEILEYEVKIALKDENCQMKPFLGLRLLRPYENAKLEVNVPEFLIKDVKACTTLAYSDQDKYDDETIIPNDVPFPEKRNTYTFLIPKSRLKLLYSHNIVWDFIK